MTTIARYKFGYSSDEWGMNRSLGLIADAAGDVCRFSDVEALQAEVTQLKETSIPMDAHIAALAERDALASELSELHKQEPVATLWRENNQKLYPGLLIDLTATGEALPTGVLHHLFAAPTTPVREPLSDNAILGIYNKVGQEDGAPYRFAGAIEAITKEQK